MKSVALVAKKLEGSGGVDSSGTYTVSTPAFTVEMGQRYESSTSSVDGAINYSQIVNLSSPLPTNQIAVLATYMTGGSYSCNMLSSSGMSITNYSGTIKVTANSTTKLTIQHSVSYTVSPYGPSGSGTLVAKANNVTWKILLGFYS